MKFTLKFPRNSCEISRFFLEFVTKNPVKSDFFLCDLSEALKLSILICLCTYMYSDLYPKWVQLSVWIKLVWSLLSFFLSLLFQIDCVFDFLTPLYTMMFNFHEYLYCSLCRCLFDSMYQEIHSRIYCWFQKRYRGMCYGKQGDLVKWKSFGIPNLEISCND